MKRAFQIERVEAYRRACAEARRLQAEAPCAATAARGTPRGCHCRGSAGFTARAGPKVKKNCLSCSFWHRHCCPQTGEERPAFKGRAVQAPGTAPRAIAVRSEQTQISLILSVNKGRALSLWLPPVFAYFLSLVLAATWRVKVEFLISLTAGRFCF